MKDVTRKRLSELILEELSDKIRHNESLREKVGAFVDFPVEKVSDAILKQLDYLLSSDLRQFITQLIEQDLLTEDRAAQEKIIEEEDTQEESLQKKEAPAEVPQSKAPEPGPPREHEAEPEPQPVLGSIMEHFAVREPFASEAMDIHLKPKDWLYIYGFSYAPTSTGKGVPTRKLSMKGIDGSNTIFLIDYGDVRLYLSKLGDEGYHTDKSGKLILPQPVTARFKFQHEQILNMLRSEEVLVTLPFWTIMQGMETLNRHVEDRYVEMLRALVDIHDASEWEVNVLAFDQHILQLPSIVGGAKGREVQREQRHQTSAKKDEKLIDKVIFREKTVAQEIHNELLITALKSKVDYMVRLDTAFINDWKPILTARYTVSKDKRKPFYQAIKSMQETYRDYELLISATSPANRFAF